MSMSGSSVVKHSVADFSKTVERLCCSLEIPYRQIQIVAARLRENRMHSSVALVL